MAEFPWCAIVNWVVLLTSVFAANLHDTNYDLASGPVRIRFLVTVNDTWDPDGCIATVPTTFLVSGKPANETEPIHVGSCDHGPLVFDVHKGSDDGYSKMTVSLTFYSSVIEDAVSPYCNISWNGTYLNPVPPPQWGAPSKSPLPSCWTAESREGYHMTYYWFRLLDWHNI